MTRQRHFPPLARSLSDSRDRDQGHAERARDQACRSEWNCGRNETRCIESIPISAESCGFPHAAQAGRIFTRVEHPDGLVSTNSYILITSVEQANMSALEMLQRRRSYWGIESGLHARLDVSALEDKSRVRLRNNAEVLALMRRASVSIACAWIAGESNPRRANLPGFHEAVRPGAIDFLTKTPDLCAAFLTASVE